MECIDVKFDEEPLDKNKSTGFINPPNHHHYHESKESEVQHEELEKTKTHSKGPSIYTQRNHPQSQNYWR